MATALSASARALLEQMSVAELMAARRIEQEVLHALLDELVIEEELTLSHQRALGRLTCATGHLREGLRIAVGILSAEYVQLLADLQSQAAEVEQHLAVLAIEIEGQELVAVISSGSDPP